MKRIVLALACLALSLQAAEASASVLTQIGSGIPTLTQNPGQGMPIGVALRGILPAGWTYYARPGMDISQPVTWPAGEPWTTTVENISRAANWRATVDWDKRAVYFDLASAPVSSSAAVATPPTAPLPTIAAQPLWVLSSGKSIKTSLDAWTRTAGWHLSWEVPSDYLVTIGATFKGDFKSAVSNFFKTAQASGIAIEGRLSEGNKTLRVLGD